MSFVSRIGEITPSVGSTISNDTFYLKQAIALVGTAAQTNILGPFPIAIRKGKIRIKFSVMATSGVSPSVTTFQVVMTDGGSSSPQGNWSDVMRIASTEVLTQISAGIAPSGSIPNYYDRVAEFELDFNANYCFIYSVLAGTNPVVLADIDIGATA